MMTARPTVRRRTHQHLRTMHSLLTSTGPGRARWPRLRESEQMQGVLRNRSHRRPRSYKEVAP